MATYIELKEQAEKLMAQAEDLRRQERQQAVTEIKAKMQAYGITPQDLGIALNARKARSTQGSAGRKASAKKASQQPIKYRGPNGEAWAGGRGRKPKWVIDALASGKRLEDFRA